MPPREGSDLDARGQPVPRESVARHARWMEAKLRENDHKGGWTREDPTWLLKRLREEADELERAMASGDTRRVAAEAADVSNFAMMVAESYAAATAEAASRRYSL